MPVPKLKVDYDKLFCMYGKKYRLPKLFLKAVAVCESALDEKAYRFELGFWNTYLKDNPQWKDREPSEVSASFGLMQLMFVVAYELGFRGTSEELCNPVINIELGAKLLRNHINTVHTKNFQSKYSDYEIALCRYNMGGYMNPDSGGNVRSTKYMEKVMRVFSDLKKKEKDCE